MPIPPQFHHSDLLIDKVYTVACQENLAFGRVDDVDMLCHLKGTFAFRADELSATPALW